MKNIKQYLFTVCVCMLIMFLPVTRVKAEKKLPTPPVTITDVKLNGDTFYPGDTVKYSFVIEDIGIDEFVKEYGYDWDFEYTKKNKGVHTVYAFWNSPGSRIAVVEHKWKGTNNKNPKIKVHGEISITEGMRSGKWSLGSVVLYMDIDSRLELREKEIEEYPSALKYEFVGADFFVKGTTADVTPPTISFDSLKLSKQTLKKNETSKLSVKVKDASKISEVTCQFALFKDGNYTKDWNKELKGKMKYNKKKKCYEYKVKYDTKKYRKAQLIGITVEDEHANRKHYGGRYNSLDRRIYNIFKRIIIHSEKG